MSESHPLRDLDDWEQSLRDRYPAPSMPIPVPPASGVSALESVEKPRDSFRNLGDSSPPGVREFYRLNHRYQTLEYVQGKRADYGRLNRRRMGVWEAMEFLNTLVDASDPDADFSQIEHLLQTAEAIRADGHPDWFILTGLLHDLGKILCLFGEPQWGVVGDTFPVGCRFDSRIVFHEFFAENPDSADPRLQSEMGIYEEGCGLDHVLLSWGHDEYLYQVARSYLPEPALWMIRYHSFYPGHREGAYQRLMNRHDHEMLKWVRAFNPYDLYSKGAVRPDVVTLRPYYESLIARYFPPKIDF